MFNIGFQEVVIIFVIALIVFGPKKLPEVGRAVGRGLREFRRASNELMASMEEPEPSPKESEPEEGDV